MRGKANHSKWLLCLLFLLWMVSAAATERVIYVDDDAVGTNNGSSWIDAFSDLQDAITVAQAGDEIRVAQGIYTPTQDTLDRDATFDLKEGVSIIGGYAGLIGMYPDFRHTKFYATILSGDIDHNDFGIDPNKEGNSHHVVTCTGPGNAAVLKGITVTGGYSDSTGDLAHGHDFGAGGGLYCLRACSPQLIDCVFIDNYAEGGGAVSLPNNHGLIDEDAPDEHSWKPVFVRCILTHNNAGGGGAVSCGRMWRPEFINCLFENNNAEYSCGAISSHQSASLKFNECIFRRNSAGRSGGAIGSTITGPEMQFINCLFENNNSKFDGGAVSSGSKSTLNFNHCVFRSNTSNSGGGAISVGSRSSLSLNQCVFRQNTTGLRGGAISVGSIKTQLINCLFVANMAGDTGGAISCPDYINGNGDSVFDLLNCTFYDNSPPTLHKPPTNSVKQPDGSSAYMSGSIITNCIFYNKPSYMAVSIKFGRTEPLIITSIYEKEHESGQPRPIPPMPEELFVDPNGADGILGTEDDDFRLAPGSPAINAGTNETEPPLPAMDLDGNPRILNDIVDLGAYEFIGVNKLDNGE
jgi:predicted outer membrane repeat protein